MNPSQLELIPVSNEEPIGPMITGQHPTARLDDMVPMITRALLMILRRRMISQEAFCRLGEALIRDDSSYLAKEV